MDGQAQRAAVIAEARSWIGTPYVHMGDVKGAGIDCAMLLARVYVEAGVVAPFDPRPYPAQWHLHHSEERYLEWLSRFGAEVARPQPGDVAIWRFGRAFSHAAIIIDRRGGIIHAEARAHKCTIGNLRETSLRSLGRGDRQRPVRFFSPWAHA